MTSSYYCDCLHLSLTEQVAITGRNALTSSYFSLFNHFEMYQQIISRVRLERVTVRRSQGKLPGCNLQKNLSNLDGAQDEVFSAD